MRVRSSVTSILSSVRAVDWVEELGCRGIQGAARSAKLAARDAKIVMKFQIGESELRSCGLIYMTGSTTVAADDASGARSRIMNLKLGC